MVDDGAGDGGSSDGATLAEARIVVHGQVYACLQELMSLLHLGVLFPNARGRVAFVKSSW